LTRRLAAWHICAMAAKLIRRMRCDVVWMWLGRRDGSRGDGRQFFV